MGREEGAEKRREAQNVYVKLRSLILLNTGSNRAQWNSPHLQEEFERLAPA